MFYAPTEQRCMYSSARSEYIMTLSFRAAVRLRAVYRFFFSLDTLSEVSETCVIVRPCRYAHHLSVQPTGTEMRDSGLFDY